MEYLLSSTFYLRGRDMDGKLILMFNCSLHTRGSKNADDLKRCLVYWIERGFRESKNDKLTMIFDMLDTGLSNIDMEFTKTIINTFKLYYPNSLNWILVYEMPWIMNGKQNLSESFRKLSNSFHFPATFQIIKKLLPKRAVDVLKFISAKNVRQYIDEENMPVSWGGKDDYVYSFVTEHRETAEKLDYANGSESFGNANNNSPNQANLNLTQRKVSCRRI